MISFLVIWFTSYFKRWVALHKEISGRWHIYLWNLWTLKRYQRENPKGRLELHDIWNYDDQANVGLYPFPEEERYCNPKEVCAFSIDVNSQY